jgi:hypothetical protein
MMGGKDSGPTITSQGIRRIKTCNRTQVAHHR